MTDRPPPAIHPVRPLPPKTPEQERVERDERQLRISAGFCLGGDHGKRLFEHLKARYGWKGEIEQPSYRPGMTFDQVASVEGQKEVVRHLMALIAPQNDEPQQKPTTATSQ